MRRPEYGWSDIVLRAGCLVVAMLGLIGMFPYPGTPTAMAQIALSIGLLALSEVRRLRQDVRRGSALRDGSGTCE